MLIRTMVVLVLCAIGVVAEDTVAVPGGATLAIRLERTVNAGRARPGDAVEATLLAPILTRGIVLVPKDAKITGHALAVEARHKGSASRLLIRFEEARWGGETASLNAYIVRQLATRQVVRNGNGTDKTCPGMSGFQTRRRTDDSRSLPQGAPTFEPMPCYDRVTRATGPVEERSVFVSPPLKDMQLQRLAEPRGATEIVSIKKNVELSRGTMLELLQTGP